MNDKIYQILYCSRNNMRGAVEDVKEQIEGILCSSRKNNAKVGVTGALFYNTVFFAQVLEGSFADVQSVFERLQLDPRHSDLVVLQSGFIAERDFSNWSMAYAGTSADFSLPFAAGSDRESAPSSASFSGDQVLGFLRDVVVKQENWALPERASSVRPMGMVAAF